MVVPKSEIVYANQNVYSTLPTASTLLTIHPLRYCISQICSSFAVALNSPNADTRAVKMKYSNYLNIRCQFYRLLGYPANRGVAKVRLQKLKSCIQSLQMGLIWQLVWHIPRGGYMAYGQTGVCRQDFTNPPTYNQQSLHTYLIL